MAKTLVALGTAAVISAVALTTSTPAAAQPWVAPVVVGSVITGAFVGAAVASSPDYYRPRGLFGYNYPNHCGCASNYYPAYAEPADPYVYAQPYGQPYYDQYKQPYYQRYERPHVQPYYQRYAQPHARPYYQRPVSYRPYSRPYAKRYYRANYQRW